MNKVIKRAGLARTLHPFVDNEKGVTHFIALLLVLSIFVVMAFAPILYHVSIMRQTTLEMAHHRALQLTSEKGAMNEYIVTLIRRDLEAAGFPTLIVEGVTYPAFPNSTYDKVLRGGNVHVELKYPAQNLGQLFGLLGATMDTSGFYLIKGDQRSEALE
jgi:hypothetical protein